MLVFNLAAPEMPEVEIYVVPASTASGQASPSESRSNLLEVASPSVLISSQIISLKYISVDQFACPVILMA